jgi:hypothetical protein
MADCPIAGRLPVRLRELCAGAPRSLSLAQLAEVAQHSPFLAAVLSIPGMQLAASCASSGARAPARWKDLRPLALATCCGTGTYTSQRDVVRISIDVCAAGNRQVWLIAAVACICRFYRIAGAAAFVRSNRMTTARCFVWECFSSCCRAYRW